MRRQTLLLLSVFIAFTAMATTLTKKKVLLETWKASTRAPIPMPIDMFIEGNDYIDNSGQRIPLVALNRIPPVAVKWVPVRAVK